MDPTQPPEPPGQNPKNALKKNAAPGTLPVSSRELAERLGISKEELKKIRDAHLTPETDWTPGQPITFTTAGVAKVRAALALPPEEAPEAGARAGTDDDQGEAPDAQPVPIPPAERVTLIVSRPAKGNARIVLCHELDAQGEPIAGREVRLQTKSNSNFRKGMRVPKCVRSHISPTFYLYEGRLPRWKGRF